MRSGKMIEHERQTLMFLLDELITSRFHMSYQEDYYYCLSLFFYDEHKADEFRNLMYFKIGFHRLYEKIDAPAHHRIIEIIWDESEREYLITTIENYLQEDNMGPTNVSKENTKFYAIVKDAEGKKTAYEIQYPSLTSRMECCFGESSVTHTVEFDQDYMRECNSSFAEWAKQKDEIENLRAENENLKTRLGKCENQLRNACEFLNGYGDVHIHIPTEMEKLDYFSRIVNYETNGETKRREFGKKVAEQVKRLAGSRGVWRGPAYSSKMFEDDNKILEDAVKSAINPFYVSSGFVKADSIDALSYSALLCRDLRLKLNSVYGIAAVGFDDRIPKIDIYNKIKDVKFANPATIVFWKDGTKTVVKAQGDEQYIPEVGLAMCICKKVMGNTRDYYRVFKHWMKKV